MILRTDERELAPRASASIYGQRLVYDHGRDFASPPLFNTDAKLDLFRDKTLELAKDYKLLLQAWAFFANHYHLVAS
ncbi:MAG: hypothetical protein ABI674_03210, partial [Spartobacteria bacterium]